MLTTPLRRLVVATGLVAVAGSLPWWGTHALRSLAFFRVRAVEVEGAHFVSPTDIASRIHLDTTASVWNELGPLQKRVEGMPGVRTVVVRRKLPSTIVVHVVERTPVALVPTAGGLRVFDGSAVPLPIDPTRVDLDLPVVASADAATLRLLANVRRLVPAFYTQLS